MDDVAAGEKCLSSYTNGLNVTAGQLARRLPDFKAAVEVKLC